MRTERWTPASTGICGRGGCQEGSDGNRAHLRAPSPSVRSAGGDRCSCGAEPPDGDTGHLIPHPSPPPPPLLTDAWNWDPANWEPQRMSILDLSCPATTAMKEERGDGRERNRIIWVDHVMRMPFQRHGIMHNLSIERWFVF